MLLRPANLLILDEPTNHLDIRSKGVLQDALLSYEGTCVIVSHDRGFLDPIVNKVLEVTPGRLRLFHDTVSDYFKLRAEERKSGNTGSKPSSEKSGRSIGEKERRRKVAALRQEKSREVAPHRKSMEEAEAQIEAVERQIASFEADLADPEFYQRGDGGKAAGVELKARRTDLERLLAGWEIVAKRIATIERHYDNLLGELERS